MTVPPSINAGANDTITSGTAHKNAFAATAVLPARALLRSCLLGSVGD